ncbi:hypothetical protein L9F63_007972, partial [Diploptera punctata]
SIGPAIGIVAASYAGCNKTATVALITCATGLMGTFYPGMKVNALDLSPNYAGTVMAIVNGIGAISGIVTPYLVGVLTPDSTVTQWRDVFWIVFAVFFTTNTLYLFMASGEMKPDKYWFIVMELYTTIVCCVMRVCFISLTQIAERDEII